MAEKEVEKLEENKNRIDKLSKENKKEKKLSEEKNSGEGDNKGSKILSEKEIAMDFATKVHKKFDKLIKASVLFGSQAKNTQNENSDIDIVIIIDDAAIKWDLELIAWYREELAKLISSSNYSKELHVNSIKLTTWWEDLIRGDPVIINILRYGEVLIDIGGFFNPLKILLQQGKIKGTVEAVYNYLQHAPLHLTRSVQAKLGAVEGIYWCMIDSAQAALMTSGKLPPSPEHVPALLHEAFVLPGILEERYIDDLRAVYILHKKIVHGEINDVSGGEIDKWQNSARAFLAEMTRIIDMVLENEKVKKNK